MSNGLHAHEDGTIHRHLWGRRTHRHPTTWDRWDRLMDRLLGPVPPHEAEYRRSKRL